MSVTEQRIRAALAPVKDPDLHLPIGELDMIRGVAAGQHGVRVSIALPVPDSSSKPALQRAIKGALGTAGIHDVSIELISMNDQDRAALRDRLQSSMPGSPTEAFSSARVVAVASGKGGVGKSSVTTNLAIALARAGLRTAIIDADVYGFSIPRMIGIDGKPAVIDRLILPPQAHGVSVISIGFFAEENSPVIWRGPMLHKALTQFVTDVYWNDPDFVIIDMPPGTGDVSLTMSQFLPATELVVVTTPQPAAQRVAQRAAYMARKVDLAVSGVIENMSWFTGHDGYRYELFGAGGGDLLAQELGVPLLGKIPFVPALREGSDAGRPIVAVDPDSEAATVIGDIAERLVDLKPRKIRLPLRKLAGA